MAIGKLSVYACGGAAANIVSTLDASNGQHEPGYSEPHIVYIDSSRSNLKDDIPDDRVELLKDEDGAGKIRRSLAKTFHQQKAAIVQRHPPGDLSVVVFSASGGSGSTVGPMLVSELLDRGASVVCIVIGTDESKIAASNTLATLKSLEAVSKATEEPVVMSFHQNSRDVPRSQVDRECRRVLASLSLLASRQNAELDSADIASWVHFQRSTSAPSSLAVLNLYTDAEPIPTTEQIVATASLYNDTDAAMPEYAPEYHCAGYPRKKIEGANELHFAIRIGAVNDYVKSLDRVVKEFEQASQSRVKHQTFVSDSDVDSDTGIVF